MRPAEVLKKYWGYTSFRIPQEKIIEEVLQGKDVLALLPTGGGKSICFQVPGLVKPGVCLVISPLIALMQDQVEQLKRRGIRAETLSSLQTHSQQESILHNVVNGAYDFLYISPERLKGRKFRERLPYMNLNLIAVDEAHCISQWGYDFRPAYREIKKARVVHPDVPVLALTASATTAVCTDICTQLEFSSEHIIRKSFVRENLQFALRKTENKPEKILEILTKVPGTSVVYTRSRKACRQLSDFLNQEGLNASYYHAGLKGEERSKKQEDWIKGKTRVIVATNAFGMGIDKADVRTVIHYHAPDSLEAYYQEAGRAGRDGNKAYAVLLLGPSDIERLKSQEIKIPEVARIRHVYHCLANFLRIPNEGGADTSHPFSWDTFLKRYELDVEEAQRAFQVLALQGYILQDLSQDPSSKVQLITNRENLHRYQVRFPKRDKVIKALLRSYGGIFDSPVRFKEDKIAASIHLPVKEVITTLKLMHADRIVEYTEQREGEILTWLEPREPTKHLRIEKDLMAWLKRMYAERNKGMLRYLEAQACRMQTLVGYFGEAIPPCGKCDYCLDLKKKPRVDWPVLILENLSTKPVPLVDLVNRFPKKHQNQIHREIRLLIDEGEVILSQDQNVHLPHGG